MNESSGSSDVIENNIMADKLLSADSPFRWKPVILEENRHIVDKEIVEKDKFSYLNFIIEIIDVYEKFDVSISKAIEVIEALEEKMDFLKEAGKDEIFNEIAVALFHVIYSSKALLFLNQGQYKELPSILSQVTEIEKMNSRNKAAMLAIQSTVIALYSYEGTCTAVSQINMALSIDNQFPLWHFLKGWYLHRIRFWENTEDKPSFDERSSFENANKGAADNALFMVYLADTYRDHATFSSKRSVAYNDYLFDDESKNNFMRRIEEKYSKSLELYRKSYALNHENPNVLFRAAYGLMTLPTKYQDLKLVKTIIITNSSRLHQSGYGNFVTACYYKHYGKNEPLAMRHFETSAAANFFNAHFSIIIYKYKKSKQQQTGYDAVQDLKNLLNVFKETPYISVITSQIVSYYVFVDLNLKEACENALKSLELDKYGNSLQRHRSCFLTDPCNRNISLIDVLTDEVKYTLGNPKIKPNEKKFFEQFIEKVNFQNVKVIVGRPQNLRMQILNRETGKGNSNARKFQSIGKYSDGRNSADSHNLRVQKSNARNDSHNLRVQKSNTRNDSHNLRVQKSNARNPQSRSDFNQNSNKTRKSNVVNSRDVKKVESALDGENTNSCQLRRVFNSFEPTKIDSSHSPSEKLNKISQASENKESSEVFTTKTVEGNAECDREDEIKAREQSHSTKKSNCNERTRSKSPKANLLEEQKPRKDNDRRSCSRETVTSARIETSNRGKNMPPDMIDDLTSLMRKQKLRDVDDQKRNRERSNSRDTVRSRKINKEKHRQDRSQSSNSYSDDEKYRKSGKKTHRRRKDSSSSRSRSVSRDRKSKKHHRRHGSRDHSEKRKRSHSPSKKRHHRRHHSRSRSRSHRRHRRYDRSHRKRSTSESSDYQRSFSSRSCSGDGYDSRKSHRKNDRSRRPSVDEPRKYKNGKAHSPSESVKSHRNYNRHSSRDREYRLKRSSPDKKIGKYKYEKYEERE